MTANKPIPLLPRHVPSVPEALVRLMPPAMAAAQRLGQRGALSMRYCDPCLRRWHSQAVLVAWLDDGGPCDLAMGEAAAVESVGIAVAEAWRWTWLGTKGDR